MPSLIDLAKREPETVLRFHIIFETEDGEGSRAKRNPVFGRAFVEAQSNDPSYKMVSERVRLTIQTYSR